MADSIEIDISGMEELRTALARLEPRRRAYAISDAVRKATGIITREAKKMAPVRAFDGKRADAIKPMTTQRGQTRTPGYLRRNIKTMKAAVKRPGAEFAYGVGFGTAEAAIYGTVIEKGTGSRAAQPFLRPAFDAKSAEAEGMIAAQIMKEIEKQWARQSGS